MFRNIKKGDEIQCPVVVSDPHVTRPGQEAAVIVRNDLQVFRADRQSEIYERARQIYYRAKSARRRSAGII